MGFGDFLSLPWTRPIAICAVIVFFMPTVFPVLVYFAPLLISTALCVGAVISKHMGSDEDEEESQNHLFMSISQLQGQEYLMEQVQVPNEELSRLRSLTESSTLEGNVQDEPRRGAGSPDCCSGISTELLPMLISSSESSIQLHMDDIKELPPDVLKSQQVSCGKFPEVMAAEAQLQKHETSVKLQASITELPSIAMNESSFDGIPPLESASPVKSKPGSPRSIVTGNGPPATGHLTASPINSLQTGRRNIVDMLEVSDEDLPSLKMQSVLDLPRNNDVKASPENVVTKSESATWDDAEDERKSKMLAMLLGSLDQESGPNRNDVEGSSTLLASTDYQGPPIWDDDLGYSRVLAPTSATVLPSDQSREMVVERVREPKNAIVTEKTGQSENAEGDMFSLHKHSSTLFQRYNGVNPLLKAARDLGKDGWQSKDASGGWRIPSRRHTNSQVEKL